MVVISAAVVMVDMGSTADTVVVVVDDGAGIVTVEVGSTTETVVVEVDDETGLRTMVLVEMVAFEELPGKGSQTSMIDLP
ncbi:hypothetical protein B0A54_03845 [Friedmanniomyces endolithicus]|uniref:Uncharacterized protein n=1 Tax=Friedmanniomyces endolithicus TaxID=329885 RepID=A0A4V5N9B0_9PEZI|nr:hypothetical protein B0A54_03845 [Friedmanniomyces endolithicus]